MSGVSLTIQTSDVGRRRSYRSGSRSTMSSVRPTPLALPVAPPLAPPMAPRASTTGRAALWAEAMNSHAPPRPATVMGGQTPVAVPGQPPAAPVAVPAMTTLTVADVRANVRGAARQIIQSKVLTALMVFLVTVLLLICLNPPMAQEPLTDEQRQANMKPRRSWKKIMMWSLLIFTLALILPVAAGYLPAGSGASPSP